MHTIAIDAARALEPNEVTGRTARTAARGVQRTRQFILRANGDAEAPLRLLTAAHSRGLQVLAHNAFRDPEGTVWLLVVNDDRLAEQELATAGYRYESEPVVLVEARPRAAVAARLTRSFAENDIEVLYSYAMPVSDDRLVAVFKTADDEAASRLMQAALQDAAPTETRLAA